MRMTYMPSERTSRLREIHGLDEEAFARLYEELFGDMAETLAEFVRRRHRELQAAGKRNEEIFTIVQAELPNRLFAAEPHSVRQIRRIIYG